MMTLSVALLGILSSIIGLVVYLRKMKKSKTPKKPIGLIISMLLGLCFGGYAVFLSNSTTELTLSGIILGFTVFIAAMLSFLLLQKKAPLGDIKVKVGDLIIPFQADTFEGKTFSTQTLKGKRTLLKFFRGSWCPYCCAELTMFDELKPELDKYAVQTIALSGDTAEQAKVHHERDKLKLVLLSDPMLMSVKKYGIEHHKAVGWSSDNMKTFFGISISMNAFKYRSMSIPTTILIDENGIIQWIDQSDDYRIRASREKITSALKQAFN
jgi:peroxiredoxin